MLHRKQQQIKELSRKIELGVATKSIMSYCVVTLSTSNVRTKMQDLGSFYTLILSKAYWKSTKLKVVFAKLREND